jgi:hypothetical protein
MTLIRRGIQIISPKVTRKVPFKQQKAHLAKFPLSQLINDKAKLNPGSLSTVPHSTNYSVNRKSSFFGISVVIRKVYKMFYRNNLTLEEHLRISGPTMDCEIRFSDKQIKALGL